MSMMTKLMTAGALAAAMTAGAADAATFTFKGVGGSANCGGVFGLPAGQIDVLVGASVNADFDDGDAAGTLCFDLNNNSATAVAVTVAFATVNQSLLGGWGFKGGVSLNSNLLPLNWSLAEGVGGAKEFVFKIAAGGTVLFDWKWGQAFGGDETVGPEFDFVVKATPVPVPAAGLLLVGALGGLVALRRRKAA